jgi:TPR repeat protein
MKTVQLFLGGVLAVLATNPALADLKTGDVAWQNGDYATAVNEWRPEAIAGNPDAQVHLGQAYQLGHGVPVDLKLAEDWFRRAAQAGSLEGKDSYGLILFQNGKRAEGLPYIEEAAGRGNPRAQYILGTALYNGDMIAKDLPRAYALMLRASAAGVPAAKNSLAEMDKYIPLDQRTRGRALAGAFEAHATAEAAAPVPAIPVPHTHPTIAAPPATKPATPEAKSAKPPKPVKVVVPKSTPAPVATPAPATGGKWRIQLGAFGDGSKANALWSGLHTRVAALRPYQPYVIKNGTMTRLQAGPLASHDAAAQLCAAVKAAKQPCMPVAP